MAFDPFDDRIMVAGGADSGVFISIDGGICWRRVTDPFTPHISGIPHIPRPRYAHFEHLSPHEIDIYIGSQGRGVWKVSLAIEDYRYEYAAKILCGRQDNAEDYRLIKGVYGTSINIHNPNDVEVTFCKKLALTYPPEEQAPGQIIGIASDVLKPDEALKVDCNDIQKRLFPDSLPAPYFEGFVVLKSGRMLDVTSVYSTAAIDPAGSISHSGIDVEPVQGRRLRNLPPSIPTPDSLPDLIPLRPDNDLSEYCITNPQGFEDFGIGVRVRNQGLASSPVTVTCVDLEFGGRICQSTPALSPGEEAILNFPLPAEACQIISSGRLECPFTITVNTGMLPESDFTNNTVDGICKGPG